MFEEMLEERSFNLPPIFSFKIEKKKEKKNIYPKSKKIKNHIILYNLFKKILEKILRNTQITQTNKYINISINQ